MSSRLYTLLTMRAPFLGSVMPVRRDARSSTTALYSEGSTAPSPSRPFRLMKNLAESHRVGLRARPIHVLPELAGPEKHLVHALHLGPLPLDREEAFVDKPRIEVDRVRNEWNPWSDMTITCVSGGRWSSTSPTNWSTRR